MPTSFAEYLHNALPFEAAQYLSASISGKEYDKREVIFHPGQRADNFLYSPDAYVRYAICRAGEEVETRFFARPGIPHTALASFIQGEPSDELIEIMEPGRIEWIEKSVFEEALKSFPSVSVWYAKYLEELYIYTYERIVRQATLSAAERLHWLETKKPYLLKLLSVKMIASLLGMSPETLSRLRGQKAA
jgi:CRP-like cAMP-binding protein